MNGIDNIIERILNEADLDRKSILSKAEDEANEIYQSLKEKADAAALEIVSRGKEQAHRIIERAQGSSELESRSMLLDTKQKLIDRAFQRAKSMLLGLPDDEYTSLLAELASSSLTTGSEEIILGQNDLRRADAVRLKINGKAAGKGLPGKVTVSPSAGDFEGGLIVRQGNIETNCTFDAILRMLRDGMAADIAGILFG